MKQLIDARSEVEENRKLLLRIHDKLDDRAALIVERAELRAEAVAAQKAELVAMKVAEKVAHEKADEVAQRVAVTNAKLEILEKRLGDVESRIWSAIFLALSGLGAGLSSLWGKK